MALIRPFAGIRYSKQLRDSFADLIAPPYDVLAESGKAQLQRKHPNNIVTIDLPHLPTKSAGPDEVYEAADETLKAWLSAKILQRDIRPALYPYAQTFDHAGRTVHRRGFIALVRLSPFGAGQVVPHEKTYKGPIEDRLKLMRATGAQLSPIFGLYSDPRHEVTAALYKSVGKPELSGTMDQVRNDLWSVPDADTENKVIDLMRPRPIYIADGHHRYTTALQHQAEAIAAAGGELPDAHPANWCMFVLIGMQDPGLLILPTHRLLGGIESFDIAAFIKEIRPAFNVSDAPLGGGEVAEYLRMILPKQPPHTFGLYDQRSGRLIELRLKNPDLLKPLEPNHSDAWRRLDVAILQRYLIDEVIQPRFAVGKEIVRGYTADPDAVAAMTDGSRHQVALLLQSTPLHALEELGKFDEVMPQKSTYFYPKLATGMVINSLR